MKMILVILLAVTVHAALKPWHLIPPYHYTAQVKSALKAAK